MLTPQGGPHDKQRGTGTAVVLTVKDGNLDDCSMGRTLALAKGLKDIRMDLWLLHDRRYPPLASRSTQLKAAGVRVSSQPTVAFGHGSWASFNDPRAGKSKSAFLRWLAGSSSLLYYACIYLARGNEAAVRFC